jgi:hypothetical protein
MSEARDPGRYDYSLGAKRLAVFNDHTKCVLLGENLRYVSEVDIG